MENSNPNIPKVQHVAKSSSDQLLRKFAEVGSDSKDKSAAKDLRLAKRVRRSCQSASGGGGGTVLPERKSLLPPPAPRKPAAALIRRLAVGKVKVRARELRNKSLISAIEKTWRRTVEGASKVLMEKHYNRHKRLINDS